MNKKYWVIAIIGIVIMAVAGFSFWQLHKPANNPGNPIAGQTADKNLVEIFYLPHAPAQAIVDKIDQIIAKYPNYTVKKYDFDDPANKQKIKDYNLVNHTPIAIFIGGKNSFTVNGKTISLSNFPKGDAFIPSFEGDWSYDDLSGILASQSQ